MSEELESPWPGPRPFTGQWQQLLFGRDRDVDELASLLQTKRVVTLSARSGIGKTSFLQAQVVPAMDADGIVTLVYRTWTLAGGGGRMEGTELLSRVVAEGVESYRRRNPERPLPEVAGLDGLAALKALQAAPEVEGVVLVLDQFEELLRRDMRLGRSFLDEIVRVAQETDVQQIVSLRDEYVNDILLSVHKELQAQARQARLAPLRGAALREIILEPPRRAPFNIEVDDDAADLLLEWWSDAADKQASTRLTSVESSDVEDLGATDVGLLHLQAVLWALYRFWRAAHPEGATRITRGDVEALGRDLLGATDNAPSGVRVITEALRRWIDEPLVANSGDGSVRQLVSAAGDQAALFAPYLSAAGYKSAQELNNLARLTLEPRLIRLGLETDGLEAALSACHEALGPPGRSTQAEAVERLRSATEAVIQSLGQPATANAYGRIAGPAYRSFAARRLELEGSDDELVEGDHVQALQAAGTELVFAFALAVHLLQSRFVLTEPPVQSGARFIELVHDGFGPALTTWAADRLDGPHVALNSLTAISGEDLLWPALDGAVLPPDAATGLCWVGCWIAGQRDRVTGRRVQLAITDMTFDDADLTGSAFEGCDFRDVTFDSCRMRGVLFKDCNFDNVRFLNADLSMTSFVNVTSSPDPLRATFLRDADGACSTFEDLGPGHWFFFRTDISQCFFKAGSRMSPTAHLRVDRSRMVQWQFAENALASIDINDCRVLFCTSDSGVVPGLMTIDDSEVLGSSFPDPAIAAITASLVHEGVGLQDRRPAKQRDAFAEGEAVTVPAWTDCVGCAQDASTSPSTDG